MASRTVGVRVRRFGRVGEAMADLPRLVMLLLWMERR